MCTFPEEWSPASEVLVRQDYDCSHFIVKGTVWSREVMKVFKTLLQNFLPEYI